MKNGETVGGGACRGCFCSEGFGSDAGQADAPVEVHPVLLAALAAVSHNFFEYSVPLGSGDAFARVRRVICRCNF